MGKYSERCKAEGIVFIPLVVDRFGGWYKDAVGVITQAGEALGEGGGGDNNEERMEQLLQRVVNCGTRPASSLSYREFIECRYIGLFRISKSISYRTSHIEYLDILKTNDFFVFFRRKFQKFSENSENSPKIQKTHEPKSSTTTTAPKIPKIRRKF